MNDLKDKVVLITGASSGIGAAAALAFGRWGCHVAVHFNSHEKQALDIVAQIEKLGARAAAFKADVTDTQDLKTLAASVLKTFGRIDILINNAGDMVQRVPLAEATDDIIARVFDLNARSMIALGREIIPGMRAQGGGAIINVTSQAARLGGTPGAGLYAASKGFVSTYTKSLARELVPFGIRVNAVAPGVIATPFQDVHSSPALMEERKKIIPMGRLGRADECSGAMLFLASEEMSGYVIGQVIEVNGGTVMP
jgi:3-oxoacyl-[acyl-carrier protein] reductase